MTRWRQGERHDEVPLILDSNELNSLHNALLAGFVAVVAGSHVNDRPNGTKLIGRSAGAQRRR